ncbi:MAG: biotin--[acetyl-CoA-carboxylase] ligase, partial [Clostridiales bacterium]|nr:biotin--[acetyl-CoA-carboxylase] ligase [Clostridiales bacterium]
MNDEILRLLHVRGDFLSGEEISRQLNISRTAVWKRIGKLKDEGYEIESVPHKGYRLDPYPRGKIYGWTLEQAFAELNSKLFRKLIFAETLDSTNLEAKRRIAAQEEAGGMVVVCEKQTAGRGRRGRSWASPAGSGLWMSLLLRPDIQPAHAPMLTLVAGMAVRDALEELYGLDAFIKWPNDIIVRDRKICGILTEMTMEDLEMSGVVVGIGINV